MRAEVMEKIADLMTAAFGLVAALAWNGAIQAIFAEVFGEASDLAAMVVYALVVTVIAVLATIWIGRTIGKGKEEAV